MKNKIILFSALLLTATAHAAEVRIGLNNGKGELTGVITDQNKFRISDIRETGPREVKVSGDLFKGLSTSEILSECEEVYSISPSVLKREKKSLYLSTTLFPYTKAGISVLAGVEAETGPSLVKLTPRVKWNAESFIRKAYPMLDATSFLQNLSSQINVSQEAVAQGEDVKMDFTGYGPLVCDILMGNAELYWKAQVSFPQPLPKVFIPVSSQEIEALSKILLTKYQWNGTQVQNIIAATSTVEEELQSFRKITINGSSKDPQALFWTRLTLVKLVEGLLSKETGKPQFMTAEKAEKLEASLTVSAYQYESRELILHAQIKGEK